MRTILKIALTLFTISFFAFTVPTNKRVKTTTVVIDVSHGGNDAGMQHNNVLEKELVQQIAQKMARLNADPSIKLHFTRTEDETIPLHHRVGFINSIQPDMVLSLHINEIDKPNVSGVSVFYSDKGAYTDKALLLANKISKAFNDDGLFNAEKAKTAPFYILKNSKAPAVVVEIGNLINPSDSEKLQNESQQEKIAKTLLAAIKAK